ncbi:MAG: hypothetical protein HW409_1191, partial [candidate division NC10 bacterium]|nr:hypothetical protein [candidate division NC10 bacterium]
MTRARAIAPPPVLYDDTPIHDKMVNVKRTVPDDRCVHTCAFEWARAVGEVVGVRRG